MTRLEKLKEEKKMIKNMKCLAFSLMEKCEEWYDKEIACIEVYGDENPEMDEEEKK